MHPESSAAICFSVEEPWVSYQIFQFCLPHSHKRHKRKNQIMKLLLFFLFKAYTETFLLKAKGYRTHICALFYTYSFRTKSVLRWTLILFLPCIWVEYVVHWAGNWTNVYNTFQVLNSLQIFIINWSIFFLITYITKTGYQL